MNDNKTSAAVQHHLQHDNPFCMPEGMAKAIAQKYRRMEEALQKLSDPETLKSWTKAGIALTAHEALSFDPLSPPPRL